MNATRASMYYAAFLFFLVFYALPSYATNALPQHFLTLSDIHFNPFSQCQEVPCPLIKQLVDAPITSWHQLLAQRDTHIKYYVDTSNTLLDNMLGAAKIASADKNIQFVLVLGDNIGHEYRRFYKFFTKDTSLAGYQSFVKKSLEFVANELNNTFPNKDIYMVVGNNDSYIGNYRFRPNSAFFKDMATVWGKLIKSANRPFMQHQFNEAGFYAVDAPFDNRLRLIILNTIMFSTRATGSHIEQYAQKQLNWLNQELQQVAQHQKQAFIIMHIPEGVDIYLTSRLRLMRLKSLWKDNYIASFETILNRYPHQLAGLLVGHLHTNCYQILTFNHNEVTHSCTSSISPIFGNDPSFNIYTYAANAAIKNIQTFIYPISKTNFLTLQQMFKNLCDINWRQRVYVTWPSLSLTGFQNLHTLPTTAEKRKT